MAHVGFLYGILYIERQIALRYISHFLHHEVFLPKSHSSKVLQLSVKFHTFNSEKKFTDGDMAYGVLQR